MESANDDGWREGGGILSSPAPILTLVFGLPPLPPPLMRWLVLLLQEPHLPAAFRCRADKGLLVAGGAP